MPPNSPRASPSTSRPPREEEGRRRVAVNRTAVNRTAGSQAAAFLRPGGALAEAIPGFEHREGQVEMAVRVEETLRRGGALMVEAGTGIGKSFAYLLPALLSGKRVVLSTATRNLQDQLFEKDLPQLQAILGSRVPAARMKGRENYLCRLEWGKFRDQPELPFHRPHRGDLEKIARWAEKTRTGDRDEIRGLAGPLDFWRGVSTISENCIGRRCGLYDSCHLTTLRKQAHASQILIVNHHLLVADLIVRQTDYGGVLPEYDHLIVDEAHRLENAATSSLSTTLSSAMADRLATDLGKFWKRAAPGRPPHPAVRRLRRSWRELFDSLAPDGEDGPRLLDPAGFPQEARESGESVSQALDTLESGLFDLREGLPKSSPPAGAGGSEGDDGNDGKAGCDRFLKRIAELRGELHTLLTPRPDFVYWSAFRQESGERTSGPRARSDGARRTWFANAAPVHPGKELQSHLFGQMRACVLTSATLALDGGFDYAADALGVETTDEAIFPTPFRFAEQARLYVPRDLVSPRGPGFGEAVAAQVDALVRASRGRALILFTSWGNLDRVGRALEPVCPFPLLRQQRGGGHAALLDTFRNTPNAVLLGVRSFWEGVDVLGDALTLLVIDKLPFPVPSDPLHQARAERAEAATGDGFSNYSVPQAALTLKQGLGRLIRSRRDRGLAAVLDSRLHRTGYGRRIRALLPPFPSITDLEEATDFLRSLP